MRDWVTVASVIGVLSLVWLAGNIVGFGVGLFR